MSTSGDNTTSPATIYADHPLSLTLPSIRLLAFSRDESGNICGRLKQVNLSNCPAFMALSYVWGSAQNDHHSILLHGKHFKIRENLFNALQNILDYNETTNSNNTSDASIQPYDRLVGKNERPLRYIWIDSVCINQDDVAERNHQVGMMKEIYSAATLVLAWVGMSNSETLKAMEIFHSYREAGPSQRRQWSLTIGFGSRYSSVVEFLNLEYFHRMWIIQELLLARRFIFMCGSEAINGNVIRSCIDSNSLGTGALSSTPGGQVLGSREQVTRTNPGETTGLVLLMCRFRDRGCRDPRDKVYALLGLAEQYSTEAANMQNSFIGKSPETDRDLNIHRYFAADYGLSPFELYLKLVHCASLRIAHAGWWNLPEYSQSESAPRSASFRGLLKIPLDLTITLDKDVLRSTKRPRATQSDTWRPGRIQRFVEFVGEAKKVKGGVSRDFLARVRSMDWSKTDSWPENYQALQQYTSTSSGLVLITLKDLEQYWDLGGWATATLDILEDPVTA